MGHISPFSGLTRNQPEKMDKSKLLFTFVGGNYMR